MEKLTVNPYSSRWTCSSLFGSVKTKTSVVIGPLQLSRHPSLLRSSGLRRRRRRHQKGAAASQRLPHLARRPGVSAEYVAARAPTCLAPWFPAAPSSTSCLRAGPTRDWQRRSCAALPYDTAPRHAPPYQPMLFRAAPEEGMTIGAKTRGEVFEGRDGSLQPHGAKDRSAAIATARSQSRGCPDGRVRCALPALQGTGVGKAPGRTPSPRRSGALLIQRHNDGGGPVAA